MEEFGCKAIWARGFSFLELMHCSVRLLRSNRAQKELIVFFSDDFWHILGDFFNSWPSIGLGLLMNLPKVPYEFLLNFIMLFYFFPMLLLNERNSVVHSLLYSGSLEELSVSLSFLQPTYPGFSASIIFPPAFPSPPIDCECIAPVPKFVHCVPP